MVQATYAQQLKEELKALREKPLFSQYRYENIRFAISAEPKEYHAVIRDTMPMLYSLL